LFFWTESLIIGRYVSLICILKLDIGRRRMPYFARDYADFGDFAESYKLENCFEILLFR